MWGIFSPWNFMSDLPHIWAGTWDPAQDCRRGRAGDSSGACRCSASVPTNKGLLPLRQQTPARTCWSPCQWSQLINFSGSSFRVGSNHRGWSVEVLQPGLQLEGFLETPQAKADNAAMTSHSLPANSAPSLHLLSRLKSNWAKSWEPGPLLPFLF